MAIKVKKSKYNKDELIDRLYEAEVKVERYEELSLLSGNDLDGKIIEQDKKIEELEDTLEELNGSFDLLESTSVSLVDASASMLLMATLQEIIEAQSNIGNLQELCNYLEAKYS